jgi:hypothetical protein
VEVAGIEYTKYGYFQIATQSQPDSFPELKSYIKKAEDNPSFSREGPINILVFPEAASLDLHYFLQPYYLESETKPCHIPSCITQWESIDSFHDPCFIDCTYEADTHCIGSWTPRLLNLYWCEMHIRMKDEAEFVSEHKSEFAGAARI